MKETGCLTDIFGREAAMRLFDLSKDIGEIHDLAESRPDAVRQLDALRAKWDAELMPPGFASPTAARRAAKKTQDGKRK